MEKTHLENLRHALLNLHKMLLDFQKKEYEGKFGVIASTGQFFELVVKNESFAWLRTLSELIVGLDELLDEKKPFEDSNVVNLLKYVESLTSASSEAGSFQVKYFAAVQKDPGVAVAHGKVTSLLRECLTGKG